jgi:sarcosine oxidase
MPSPGKYDVIVVGLGAMGSATLFHLARRGVRVLGLEQFTSGHRFGSSHGDSRIIRETYFEHPLYVPLVRRAHDLWRELESIAGVPLMKITGGLMIGPHDGSVVSGTLRSAREHNLPYEILTASEVNARFPAFEIKPDVVAVFDPRAGYLDPEACIRAHLEAARAAGAETHFQEPLLEWSAGTEGIQLHTSATDYLADRVVLAAGPWMPAIAAATHLPLEVERQSVFWFDAPVGASAYEAERFPIYAYEFKPGTICYGFPRLARGIKASVMHDGSIAADPESVDRRVTVGEVKELRSALRPILPMLSNSRVRDSAICLFTNTPDHDFIIDFLPQDDRVLISSPCSGHGFKFASAIGEVQADLLTTGRSSFDLSPFRIGRWPRKIPIA